MNKEIKTGSFNFYTVKTPDHQLMSFYQVPYKSAIAILEKSKFRIEEITLSGLIHKAYFIDKMVLFEETLDHSYYLLFDSQEEFKKFRSGKLYWDVAIFFDKNDHIYASFGLKCEQTSELIKNSFKKDHSFQINGTTQTYTLYYLPDGSMCYLTHRINDWYDGYWFSSFDQFKYTYDNVFN